MTERTIYEFGDVRVDAGRASVTRAGVPVPLEPKAFDLLVYLIARRDRLVSKDELLDALWPATFVTPNVLTRAVAQIRKALGDESSDARYIETIQKRGYRFIAGVTEIPSDGVRPGSDLISTAPSASTSSAPGAQRNPHLSVESLRPGSDLGRRWAIAAIAGIVALAALAAALISLAPRRSETSNDDLQLRRLTNRRGFSGMPTLSPDGRAMVYASDATGALELYLVTLVEGSAEVPLTNDRGQNMQPAWSPDGQWIAFHSRGRGGVWIVPSTGGVPQQVVEFGSDPAWSPDSSALVFTSDAGGLAGQSALWTIRRDGGSRRQLTTIGEPPGGHRAPAWSHDGRHVAFVVTRGGWDMDLWIVPVASGAPRLVTRSTNAADPCFAPDDRALYWGGTTPTGNGRLFKRDLDADANPIGADEAIVPMDTGIVQGVTLAPNGVLAFALQTQDANLWAVDVRDGRPAEPVRLTDDTTRSTHADYAPDGARLAYLQVPIGTPPTVWIMRDDGTGKTPLMAGTDAFNPRWDARGERILVARRSAEGGHEFAWVDVAARRMTSTGLPMEGMLSARLSPDSRQLAFHRIEADGRMSVWVGGFDGSRTRIATDPEAVSYPAWSPDGQWLAVELKRGDSTHIALVARGGGAVEQLTSARGQSWPHSWSPDSEQIVFAGEREGIWNVYSVARRTRAVAQLTSFTAPTGYVRYPSWSPKGSRIVFERAINEGSVWTMAIPK